MDEYLRILWDVVSCANRLKLAFRQELMTELALGLLESERERTPRAEPRIARPTEGGRLGIDNSYVETAAD